MKKAALIALFPLLLSTTAHAQNAVALCNLYQMRASSPNEVIKFPAPTDAPQLGVNGGLLEIHKDGKVLSNGQDVTAATTALCASNPKPGAEEAGMKGDATAAATTTPVKHTVHHHKPKAAPKPDASTDATPTTGGGTDITAAPVTAAPAPESTSGTLGQLPANSTTAAAVSPPPAAMTPPSAPSTTMTAPMAPATGMAAPQSGMLAPKPAMPAPQTTPTAPPAQ